MLPSAFSFVRWATVGVVIAWLSGCGGSSESSDATGGASSGGKGGGSGGGSGGAVGGSGGSGATTTTGGSAGTAQGGSGGSGAGACFADKNDGIAYVNYDQFNPVIDAQCAGTNHQDVQNVERLVFLGDSITVGTFPTPGNQVYRELLTTQVKTKWPAVEVQNCAVNGAKTTDFFEGDMQISKCFPGPESKKTLIVMTMGGNDIKDVAQNKAGPTEANAAADTIIANMRKAVTYLKDPVNFPNGSYVFFANVYEYTDLTGDLGSCPTAGLIGLSGTWESGMAALIKMREGYMKIAVDTKSDMTFLGELFCGHGYKYQDTAGQCYTAGSTNWFDISCIHPTPEGHKQISDQFWAAISG